MMQVSRRAVAGGGGALMLATALGLGGCDDGTPTPTLLRRSMGAAPESLDPLLVGPDAMDLMRDLFEGLLTMDAAGRPIPGLAERHMVSADGLSYRFILRPGLRYSDGRPIPPGDVLASLRRLPDLGTIEMLDIRTVVIRLTAPDATLPARLAAASAAIVPSHAFARLGPGWASVIPTGSGSYRLARRHQDGALELARNRFHYDAAPVRIETVIYRPITDPAEAIAAYAANEVDVVATIPPAEVERIGDDFGFELHNAPTGARVSLLLNDARPPTSDPAVREAMSLAIDRARLTGMVSPMQVQPVEGLLGTTMPMPARLVRARQLLAGTGVADGQGPPLLVKLADDDELRGIGGALAAMWRAIGLEVAMEPGDGVNATLVGADQAASEGIAPERMAEHVLIPLYVKLSAALVGNRVKGWIDNPAGVHLSRWLRMAEP